MKPKYMNEHRNNTPPKKQIKCQQWYNTQRTVYKQCTNSVQTCVQTCSYPSHRRRRPIPTRPVARSGSNTFLKKRSSQNSTNSANSAIGLHEQRTTFIGTFFFHLTTSPTTRCGGGSIPPPEEPLPLSLPPPVVVHPWSLLPPYLHLLSRRLRRHL